MMEAIQIINNLYTYNTLLLSTANKFEKKSQNILYIFYVVNTLQFIYFYIFNSLIYNSHEDGRWLCKI